MDLLSNTASVYRLILMKLTTRPSLLSVLAAITSSVSAAGANADIAIGGFGLERRAPVGTGRLGRNGGFWRGQPGALQLNEDASGKATRVARMPTRSRHCRNPPVVIAAGQNEEASDLAAKP